MAKEWGSLKPENEYLVAFGFLSKEQLSRFTKEKSGQYDIMKLIKEEEDYLDLITNFNCKYWLLSKLSEFGVYKVTLEEIKDEEKG